MSAASGGSRGGVMCRPSSVVMLTLPSAFTATLSYRAGVAARRETTNSVNANRIAKAYRVHAAGRPLLTIHFSAVVFETPTLLPLTARSRLKQQSWLASH